MSKVFVRQPVLQILVGHLYSTKRFDYVYNTCCSVNIYSTTICLGNMLSSFTLLIKIEHLSLFGMIDKDLSKKKQCLFPFFSFFIFRTYQMQWHWTYFGINNHLNSLKVWRRSLPFLTGYKTYKRMCWLWRHMFFFEKLTKFNLCLKWF